MCVVVFAASALAHRIDIKQHSQECFYEALSPLDKVSRGAGAGADIR